MRLRHVLIAFLLLVVCSLVGITGSGLAILNRYEVIHTNQKLIFGQYQGIRGDEWGVLTPLCLSQMKHKPPFPIVNKTIDVKGKNMLIVHDFGVPVKHISTIARPTTWGYFTGSIRFGMAWNWLFPIFIGFVGISLLFNLLIGVGRMNMLIAFAVIFAPICSAWSYFSLYELGLGSVAVWSFLQILKECHSKLIFLYALLCGWAAASFALTLYLPRLIPMTWLFIVFALCIVVKDDLYKKIKEKKPYISISILFVCAIMALWYLDAKDGIAAMLNSAYPGKRFVLGGTFTAFDFLRGYFPWQLVYYKAPFSNQSELSSFPNLIALIIFLPLFYIRRFKSNVVPLFLLGVLIFLQYVYQYCGFPTWLSQITMLGRSHPRRLDSTLMLAQILFLIYFVKNCDIGDYKININSITCFLIILVFSGSIVFYAFNYDMKDVVKEYLLNNHQVFLFVFLIMYIFMVYSYTFKDWRYGTILLSLLFVFPGIMFNPVSIAPRYINSYLPDYITKAAGTNKCRILFITGERWEANSGNAAGIASLNGVHHYIDTYMYKNFYKRELNGEKFQRFNHTILDFDENINNYKVDAYGHFIKWIINPKTFDFREMPIKYVVVSNKNKGKLLKNESLSYVGTKKRFAYFKVKV